MVVITVLGGLVVLALVCAFPMDRKAKNRGNAVRSPRPDPIVDQDRPRRAARDEPAPPSPPRREAEVVTH